MGLVEISRQRKTIMPFANNQCIYAKLVFSKILELLCVKSLSHNLLIFSPLLEDAGFFSDHPTIWFLICLPRGSMEFSLMKWA